MVLLVEPAPEEATIMELRLVAQGFDVKVARNADQAIEFAESDTINYVLSEVELQPTRSRALAKRVAATRMVGALTKVWVHPIGGTGARKGTRAHGDDVRGPDSQCPGNVVQRSCPAADDGWHQRDEARERKCTHPLNCCTR